ncbi:MAG: hypothetical protein RR048_06365 [Oscillospiraceae bacterium]
MDFITLALQIMNIIFLVAIIVSVGLMLYHGTKIIVNKSREIDKTKNKDINSKNQ